MYPEFDVWIAEMTQHCSCKFQAAPTSTLRPRLPYSAQFYKIRSLLPATPRRKLGPPE